MRGVKWLAQSVGAVLTLAPSFVQLAVIGKAIDLPPPASSVRAGGVRDVVVVVGRLHRRKNN
jgi:hypothetical protein